MAAARLTVSGSPNTTKSAPSNLAPAAVAAAQTRIAELT